MNSKTNHLALIAILVLFLIPEIGDARFHMEKIGNSLYVSTDQVGVSGLHGCNFETAEVVPAYVFLLYKKSNPSCDNKPDEWKLQSRLSSDETSVTFENLPDGEYKVDCRYGKAIGCMITGGTKEFPDRSIVYYQEKSSVFYFGDQNDELQVSSIPQSQYHYKEKLELFPNPTDANLTIMLEAEGLAHEVRLVVYNLLGQEVQVNVIPLGQNVADRFHTRIDVSKLSEGAYLLGLSDDSGKHFQEKFIVQKK